MFPAKPTSVAVELVTWDAPSNTYTNIVADTQALNLSKKRFFGPSASPP